MLLTGTTSGTTAVVAVNQAGYAKGGAGIVTDVLITGADSSTDVAIADETGTWFSVASVDATTTGGLKYKVDDAAILRNQVSGAHTVTPANNTGAITVKIFIDPL